MTQPAATQHALDLIDFARDVMASDHDFADRVKAFEGQHGPASEDTLAILAQAICLCPHNLGFGHNLREVCRAIGAGKPTSFYFHGLVTPERWVGLHAYAIGVQCWLGRQLPVPDCIDEGKVREVGRWLGERHPAKVALAEMLLTQLIDDLLNYVQVAKLCTVSESLQSTYPSFAEWYVSADGEPYAARHPLTDACHARFTYRNQTMVARVEDLKQRVREAMPSATKDATELMRGILTETQLPCMHRFTRYLDLQITSIGALKWRGAVPDDDGSKERWSEFQERATAAVDAWLEGSPPEGELAEELHELLGEATEERKAIVRDFLLTRPKDPNLGWEWLQAAAHADLRESGRRMIWYTDDGPMNHPASSCT